MNIFQWIVDWSQKQPHWWGRQTAGMTFVGAMGSLWFAPWDSALKIVYLWACFFLQVILALSQLAIACDLEAWDRKSKRVTPHLLMFDWAYVIVFLLLSLSWKLQWQSADVAVLVVLLSFPIYDHWASCKPPAPPKPKTRLARSMT